MATMRVFGLLNAAWPRNRRDRPEIGGERQIDVVARHFRKERLAVQPAGAATPTYLSLTNLTLCPRLEILWQSHHAATIERPVDQPLHTDRSTVLHEQIEGHPAPELALDIQRIERHWHRFASLRRTFLARDRASLPIGTVAPLAERPSLTTHDRVTHRKQISWQRRSQHQTERHARFLRSERHHLTEEKVERVTRVAETRQRHFLRTTVARRVTTLGSGDNAAPQLEPADGNTAKIARRPTDLVFPASRASASPELGFSPADAASSPPARASASQIPSSPERVFRTPPAVQPPATAAPSEAPIRQPGRTASPDLDITRLDKELWRRFEKRIRIERERRGRG